MKHDYTTQNLIQFIYGECDLFQKLETEFALENDPELRREYDNLVGAYNDLPKIKFSPSKSTVKSILEFASNNLELAC